MLKNNSTLQAVADVETAFVDDDILPHSTGAAATKTDSCAVSKMPAVAKPGKFSSSNTSVKSKQNNIVPVANGALENENSDADVMQVCSRPATHPEVTATLRKPEPDMLPLLLSDTGASGDHCKQQPVSPGNSFAEPVSDAEFIAVVRRKRRDPGAKQKTRQSEELCSFWQRRPARPAYASPRSNIHQSAGTASPSQVQPASQKLSNLPGVDLLDSTASAFPALASMRVRRSSTGDVPAASESNDDGSDLESVKSMQTSSSRRTVWGRSHGPSSYASVVVGNTSSKELAGTSVSQLGASITQLSPHSDGGLESSVSCPHSSDPSICSEVAVHVSPVEVACGSSSITDQLDSSDFMVASSLVHDDQSCTDLKVGYNDRRTQSGLSARSHASRRSVLFFDTRSKTSSNTVPSLDISFGFDDSLTSAATSSNSAAITEERETSSAAAPHGPQAEYTARVEFLQRSSVAHPSSSDTSAVSIQRSSFDLRAAQKYLLSGKYC